MAERLKKWRPPITSLLFLTLFTPSILYAQFEKILSVNLYGGPFSTVGTNDVAPEGSPGDDYTLPTLMPNFKMGTAMGGSFQVNMNRHFSLEISVGILRSQAWYYDASDGDQEPFNYLYYEVYEDTIDYEIAFSGENEMALTNLAIGLSPKYYFLPGKKVNPFATAGITFNMTHVTFTDNASSDYAMYGRLDELEDADEYNWFSDHSGIGVSLGGGAEVSINDFIGVFGQVHYYWIPLKAEAFIYELKYADFHAINLAIGIRLSFLKSKKL